MNDIEIPAGGRLADWRPLLESWQATLAQVVDHTHAQDAPYLHGEHGNSHLLATAASRLQGMSSMREVVGNRSSAQGRLDMCLLTDRRMDMVEAKYREFDLDDAIPRAHLLADLALACRDAASYRNEHRLFTSPSKATRRIGIVYVVPYFSSLAYDGAKLAGLLDFLRTCLAWDALACNFPEAARGLHYWGGRRLHPGVIAVASVVSEMPATA